MLFIFIYLELNYKIILGTIKFKNYILEEFSKLYEDK